VRIGPVALRCAERPKSPTTFERLIVVAASPRRSFSTPSIKLHDWASTCCSGFSSSETMPASGCWKSAASNSGAVCLTSR